MEMKRMGVGFSGQKNSFLIFCFMLCFCLMLSSCYHRHSAKRQQHAALVEYSDKQLDSISFSSTHHYTNKYNFVVATDSLVLIKQQPEEYVNNLQIDSFSVKKNCLLVVSDIRMIPQDSIDSVWVQLATEENQFGWVHESKMLPKVVPDDPISQFISFFSNVHLLVFLIVISIIAIVYAVIKLRRGRVKLVHFNDIDSFYPSLLALIVAASATFYASIQLFAPDQWRAFYFNPSLNPFSQPLLLEIFLVLVWAMPIAALAAIDDIWRKLDPRAALFYLASLLAVCAVNYILFSVSTLYYLGYPLLLAYILYAVRRYWRHSCVRYYCGNCGAELRHKGRCPHCGAINQ